MSLVRSVLFETSHDPAVEMCDITLVLQLAGIVAVLVWVYKWITRDNDYFKKRGIAYEKPRFLFGNTAGVALKTVELREFSKYQYELFPNKK